MVIASKCQTLDNWLDIDPLGPIEENRVVNVAITANVAITTRYKCCSRF